MKLTTKNSDFYPNKTRLYVAPSLQDWSDIFIKKLDYVSEYITGIGISDAKYYDYIDNCIFICTKQFPELQEFLTWFREDISYNHDYQRGNKHMLVIKIPPQHEGLNFKFTLGKYSLLYSKEDIDRLFQKTFVRNGMELPNKVYRVLTKDPSYIPIFQADLRELYKTKSIPNESEIVELEIPPDLADEVFDYHYDGISSNSKELSEQY